MKYIRNEEGIFEELTPEEVVRYGYYDKCKYIKTKYGIRLAGNVIKESEKLDELCDVLVIEEQNIYDNGKHKYLMEQPFIFEGDGYSSKRLSTKGAIWTDKGLIYVTDVSAEGKFELLYDR